MRNRGWRNQCVWVCEKNNLSNLIGYPSPSFLLICNRRTSLNSRHVCTLGIFQCNIHLEQRLFLIYTYVIIGFSSKEKALPISLGTTLRNLHGLLIKSYTISISHCIILRLIDNTHKDHHSLHYSID